MRHYADMNNDLPSPYHPKRAIFYRQGLKVYGLLPYILQRKLKAQFFSGVVSWGPGVRIMVGSWEPNWTAIPYQQAPEKVQALLDWLYSEQGFEVAIASSDDWDDDIFSSNFMRHPPQVWYPVQREARPGYMRVFERQLPEQCEIIALLALPAPGKRIDESE